MDGQPHMNENDLRQALVIMATAGLVMKYGKAWLPEDPWTIADLVIEAGNKEPEQEVGIVAAKPKRRTKSA